MRLCLSCELCDDAFCNLAENGWAADPAIQKRHGIRVWARFRDDILVVYTSFDSFSKFAKEVESRVAGIWKLKYEHISFSEVSMLDISVYEVPGNRPSALKWRPFFKPSSRAVPLATSSAHMQSVHGWPTADLNRLATNSCCLSDFESAKLHCVSHLMSGMMHQESLMSCCLTRIVVRYLRRRASVTWTSLFLANVL